MNIDNVYVVQAITSFGNRIVIRVCVDEDHAKDWLEGRKAGMIEAGAHHFKIESITLDGEIYEPVIDDGREWPQAENE